MSLPTDRVEHMSLCPLSWRNIQKLNRQHNRHFIQITAHHSGILVAVDTHGDVYEIDRRTTPPTITPDPDVTAVARRVRDGIEGDDEWSVELRRRLSTLTE